MFIERRNGVITCAWTCKQSDEQESIADDDPEYLAFRDRATPRPQPTARDAAIDALLAKEALDPRAPQAIKAYTAELAK